METESWSTGKSYKRPVVGKIWIKSMCAVSLAVCTILGAFLHKIEEQSYQHQLQDIRTQQKLLTDGQAVLLSDHLFSDNSLATFQILSGLLANPTITGVRIDFFDGRVPVVLGEIESGLNYLLEINHYDVVGDRFHRVGTITSVSTTRYLDQNFEERSKQLLVMVFVVVVAILIVTAVSLHYFVSSPLMQIVKAINSAHEGNPEPINWSSDDEMGYVVQQLNKLHQLQQQREDGLLKELSDSEIREQRRITSLANASLEGILILQNDKVVEMNDPMALLLGESRESLIGATPDKLFDEEVVAYLKCNASTDDLSTQEFILNSISESSKHIEIHLREIEFGSSLATVAVFRDVTSRVKANSKMRYLALHDSLTSLPNRSYYMDHLEELLNTAKPAEYSFAVMYIDLDRFKSINDSLGHEVGDDVLRRTGNILKEICGDIHFAARLGGDEFAIIYFDEQELNTQAPAGSINSFQPEILAQTIISEIENYRNESRLEIEFGVSIGIAIQEKGTVVIPELLSNADKALYSSKNAGRNRYTIYHDDDSNGALSIHKIAA